MLMHDVWYKNLIRILYSGCVEKFRPLQWAQTGRSGLMLIKAHPEPHQSAAVIDAAKAAK